MIARRTELRDEWLGSQRRRFTVDGYSSAIRRYFRWCDSLGLDAFAVSSVELEAYRGYLVSLGLAPASVARGLVAVRSFLAFADGG